MSGNNVKMKKEENVVKKKMLSIMLSGIIAAGLLTGCGSSGGGK